MMDNLGIEIPTMPQGLEAVLNPISGRGSVPLVLCSLHPSPLRISDVRDLEDVWNYKLVHIARMGQVWALFGPAITSPEIWEETRAKVQLRHAAALSIELGGISFRMAFHPEPPSVIDVANRTRRRAPKLLS